MPATGHKWKNIGNIIIFLPVGSIPTYSKDMIISHGCRSELPNKSTRCSSKAPGFNFQNPHSGSQPYLQFQVTQNPPLAFTLGGHQKHKWCTDMHVGKINMCR